MIITDDLKTIFQQVRYKNWRFVCGEDGDALWLQALFTDSKGEEQRCRKWRVSRHATLTEIVQTCLAAVLAAEEHEAREQFKYAGVALFGPHLNVEELLRFTSSTRLDQRKQQEGF